MKVKIVSLENIWVNLIELKENILIFKMEIWTLTDESFLKQMINMFCLSMALFKKAFQKMKACLERMHIFSLFV